MNKKLKNKWIKALKSGDYKQTSDDLRDEGPNGESFCCLGVLCEIQGFKRTDMGGYEVPVGLADLPDSSLYSVMESNHIQGARIEGDKIIVEILGAFPPFMEKALGLDKKVKVRGETKNLQNKLIEMNDDGTSFEKIAAYLEKINL